jgi:hypothetical protein
MADTQDLIAPCGLYCGDCHCYQQRIPNLARDLREELRNTGYKKLADLMGTDGFVQLFGQDFEAFRDYDKCCEVLEAMDRLRCSKGCRAGSEVSFCRSCRIRECCQKKGLAGCWECPGFETCNELDFMLRPAHGEGHIKNLKIIKTKGAEEFVRGKRNW